MQSRKITPDDVSNHMKDYGCGDPDDAESYRLHRRLESLQSIIEALVSQLNTTQLLAVYRKINFQEDLPKTYIRENYGQQVELIE